MNTSAETTPGTEATALPGDTVEGLLVRDLTVYRGRDQAVVTGLDLTLPRGRLGVVVGPNGAGKSSLLQCLAGEDLRWTGAVSWAGRQVVRERLHARARGVRFVYVGAEHRVFPALDVRDNLLVGAEAVGLRPKRETFDYVLGLFPNLEPRLGQAAGTLSGGEQQMVAFGRGLMSEPNALLLDEPSAGLSPRAVGQVAAAINEMTRRGMTVLLAEQNLDLADRTDGDALLLQHGRRTWHGRTGELSRTDEVVEAVLGERRTSS